VEIKHGRERVLLRGPMDAVRHLMDRCHDIAVPTTGARLSGEVTQDGEDFKAQYERVESDPLAGVGKFSGIQQIDEALRGAKNFELWTHAAFTGGLKSTFALNWAYNQAVYFRYDVCFFSLEMPYDQCRRILYSIHSLHGKFRDIRMQLGLQKNANLSVGVNYEKIRDGGLSPAEKEFLFNHVVPDFNSGDYGKIHIEVSDPDKVDFTVVDLKSKAELIYAKSPFSTLFADHAGLFAARHWVPSTTERLNEVLRDLKRLAMNFNRGAGMPVVALFQISREGFRAAEKAAEKTNGTYSSGPYNLTHLSYANEAERSSDIVTASYVDSELRAQNRVLFQCLKSRDNAPFQNFFARVEWGCRRLLTSHEVPLVQSTSNPDRDAKQVKNTMDELSGVFG
jgi:hypothetical protein